MIESVRTRIHCNNRRAPGADYLAYTLLDSIIDGFFPSWKPAG